jgi:hypothetical protein
MRFPSRLIPGAPRGFALLAFAVAVATLGVGGGCEDKHIGRPCELGANGADAGSGATAVITSPALECPSRICIQPGAEKAVQGTGPLCTAGCSTDDDCSDGESGSKTDPTDPRCKSGFTCMWPTTVGSFCCQKMCVCRDFVTEPMGGFKPPMVCTSKDFGCQNVH